MKRKNLIIVASLFAFASFFAACEKSETVDPMVDLTQDDDMVSALFDDSQNEVDELTAISLPAKSSGYSADYTAYSGSGTRTVVKSFSGDTVIHTITFENFTNNRSGNGHIKNGVIIVKVVGGPLQEKFERTITLQNFMIDDNKIEGKRQINRIAEYKYSVTLTGGKITFADGTFYTHEFNRTRTWVEGFNTLADIWDDVYAIEGTATGINRKGNAYTHTITVPLVAKNACRWIVEGTVEMVSNNKTAVLDYGMGECDNLATVTVDGKTNEIQLRGKR